MARKSWSERMEEEGAEATLYGDDAPVADEGGEATIYGQGSALFFEVAEGADRGEAFPVKTAGTTMLGRVGGENVDIPLRPVDASQRKRYSREHACVDIEGGSAILTVLYKGENGAAVNGHTLREGQRVRLHNNDRVRLLDIELIFREGEGGDITVYDSAELTLEAVAGPNTGQQYPLRGSRGIFGRPSADNTPDFPLHDPNPAVNERFSRKHAELVKQGAQYYVCNHHRLPDAVRVNGRPVPPGQSVYVAQGAMLQMYSNVFRVNAQGLAGGVVTAPFTPGASRRSLYGLWLAFFLVSLAATLGAAGYGLYVMNWQPVELQVYDGVSRDWAATAFQSTPAVGLLNGDGVPDLVFGGNDGEIQAIDGNNHNVWAQPVSTRGKVTAAPAIGDVTGDGQVDVVVGSQDFQVLCIDGASGDVHWRFSCDGPVYAPAALGTLVARGQTDVVVGAGNDRGTIYALGGMRGNELWRYHTGAPVKSAPVVADLDGDGLFEVVCGSSNGKVVVLDAKTGEFQNQFQTRDEILAGVAVADFDGNGRLALVIASKDHSVYLVDGTSMTLRSKHTFESPGFIMEDRLLEAIFTPSPAVGHINDDGVPDVVVGHWLNTVVALDGRDISARPIWSYTLPAFMLSSPALADMNGDGKLDVVVTCDDGKVYVIDPLGRKLAEKAVGGEMAASPVVGDFDNNGTYDIAVVTERGRLAILKTNAPSVRGAVAWAGLMNTADRQGRAISGPDMRPFIALASSIGGLAATALFGMLFIVSLIRRQRRNAAAGLAPVS